MDLSNIKQCDIKNSRSESITITPPVPPSGDYAKNVAYFIADPTSFDGLANVAVADEQFATDNTNFRMQFAKIQYAPREIMIIGKIYTPRNEDPDISHGNRVDKLRNLLHTLSARGYLAVVVQLNHPLNSTYTWYCHLRGANAIQVTNYTTHYTVTINLYGEDPFLYAPEAIVRPDENLDTTVTNNGDAPYYAAKIEIAGSQAKPIQSYGYTDATTHVEAVGFVTAVPNPVTITAIYPGQIISIEGTDLRNINLSAGSAFLQIPVGTSTWRAKTSADDSIGVTITTRTPYAGIAP